MNLVLTGFMGAGKTTTGRHLARLLKVPFFDSDVEIERERGPIAEIFASVGEVGFRKFETSVIERLSAAQSCVIAVGGGAVVSPHNRRLLRRNGVIVHLCVSAATAHARIARRGHRPLLGSTPDLDSVRTLMQQRAAAYADNDFRVRVDGKSTPAIARDIAGWFERRQNGGR
jgi:shikimate kinase